MSRNCGSCQGNPNSRKSYVPKFTTFLNQVLYSLLMLENKPQQRCGVTIKEISKYMRENFQVCGDLSSQVQTSLNEALASGYVYENESKFSTVGAIAKIQLCRNPERKKELVLESMQIFTHKPHLTVKSANRKHKKCSNKPKPCKAKTNLNEDIFNQSTDVIEEMISQLCSVLKERQRCKDKEAKSCTGPESLKKCEKLECPQAKKDCKNHEKIKCEDTVQGKRRKCEAKKLPPQTALKPSCNKPCETPVNKKCSVSSSKKCKSNLEIAKVSNSCDTCEVQTFASDFGLAKMPQKDNATKSAVYVPTSTSSSETPKKAILRKRRFVKKKCQKRKLEDSGNCSESECDSVSDESSESESDGSCKESCCKSPRKPRVKFSKECKPKKRSFRNRKRKKSDCL